jgi:hypothetical protein
VAFLCFGCGEVDAEPLPPKAAGFDKFAGSEFGRTKCARRVKTRDGFHQSLSPSHTVWSPTGDTVGDQITLQDSASYTVSPAQKANQTRLFFALYLRLKKRTRLACFSQNSPDFSRPSPSRFLLVRFLKNSSRSMAYELFPKICRCILVETNLGAEIWPLLGPLLPEKRNLVGTLAQGQLTTADSTGQRKTLLSLSDMNWGHMLNASRNGGLALSAAPAPPVRVDVFCTR